MKEAKFLPVDIYRSGKSDCSNNGATAKTDRMVVECSEGWMSIEDVERNGYEVLRISQNRFKTFLKPASISGHSSFGGCFAWSSDSRFRQVISESPLAIHDRVEG